MTEDTMETTRILLVRHGMTVLGAEDRFADLLGRMPVKVILDPKTALRGAAAYLAGAERRS